MLANLGTLLPSFNLSIPLLFRKSISSCIASIVGATSLLLYHFEKPAKVCICSFSRAICRSSRYFSVRVGGTMFLLNLATACYLDEPLLGRFSKPMLSFSRVLVLRRMLKKESNGGSFLFFNSSLQSNHS